MSEAVPPPTPSPRIAGVKSRRGDRAKIELDDGRSLDVAARLLVEWGLRKGDPLDPADEARLVEQDTRVRAREAALLFPSTVQVGRALVEPGLLLHQLLRFLHHVEEKLFLLQLLVLPLDEKVVTERAVLVMLVQPWKLSLLASKICLD